MDRELKQSIISYLYVLDGSCPRAFDWDDFNAWLQEQGDLVWPMLYEGYGDMELIEGCLHRVVDGLASLGGYYAHLIPIINERERLNGLWEPTQLDKDALQNMTKSLGVLLVECLKQEAWFSPSQSPWETPQIRKVDDGVKAIWEKYPWAKPKNVIYVEEYKGLYRWGEDGELEEVKEGR